MAVDATNGSGMDLNQLLNSALQGGTMSNLFGNDAAGMPLGLVLGLALSRGGLFGNNNGVDGAVGAAGFSQPQANMSLMAGIGDIKQAVAVAAEAMVANNAMQTGQIQNQVSGVAAALTNTVTMAKDSATQNTITLMQQLNASTTALMNDGDKTRAAIAALADRIPSARELDLERQLGVAQANNRQNELFGAIRSGNVEVTTTVNQMQTQQQQQQQINGLIGLVHQLSADQRVTQGVLNIGSGTVSGNSQTAANTRVA
jgi:hypothetical protein